MKISRRHYWIKLAAVCLISSIFIVIVLTVVIVRRHGQLLKVSPSSPLAFWQDNRTIATGRPLPSPIITIDKVNLTNFTLVITACCRNTERYLIRFQKNIRAIGNLFRNYRIYLSESDSEDGTLKFIQEWAKNDSNHVHVHTAGNQRRKLYLRTRRIAYCRNLLFKRARADMPSFDYYLVVDVDKGSSPNFTVDGFLSNFIYPSSSWAIMTASQTDFYYDLWALRSWPIMSSDFIERARESSLIMLASQSNIDGIFSIQNRGIPVNHPLIDVESAFGGAAIYDARYLSDECVYNGWKDHGIWFFREQCEHVSFNRCVRRNAGDGKVFINPRFQTTCRRVC